MALNSGSVGSIGGGASQMIFGSKAAKLRAKGNEIEAASYREAAKFAMRSAEITRQSNEIKLMQQARFATQAFGSIEANVAGNNMAMSGSALDIMRDSQQQAALERSVMEKEGMLKVEGYQEQARSLNAMAAAADVAAKVNKMEAKAAMLSGGVNIAAGVVGLGTGMSGGGGGVDPISGG